MICVSPMHCLLCKDTSLIYTGVVHIYSDPAFFMFLGLPLQEGIRGHAGSSGRDDGGLLAHAVGTQLHHHCHAHQTTRNGQGRSLCLLCPDHQTMHAEWAGVFVHFCHAHQTTRNG